MKIYLTIPGEVIHDFYRIYYNKDDKLNYKGIAQAYSLENRLKDINYDIIFSSPLVSAEHTVRIINSSHKQIIVDNRLTERYPGSLSGQQRVISKDEYWNYYSKIKYGTSERIVPFFDRIFNFIKTLKATNYDSVLIVSHSGVSRAFYAYFNGIPKDGRLLDKGLKNCEIIEYCL